MIKILLGKKEEFHTWDNWCLLKLEELGRSTQKEWAKAMEYNYPASISGVIRNNVDKLIITLSRSGRRKFYEIEKD